MRRECTACNIHFKTFGTACNTHFETQSKEIKEFREHIANAAKTVESWPEWKKHLFDSKETFDDSDRDGWKQFMDDNKPDPVSKPRICTSSACGKLVDGDSAFCSVYCESKSGVLRNSTSVDPVSKPSHYTGGNIECIDAIAEATKGLTGVAAFCVGNAMKYLWRHTKKNGTEDLEKARWYIDRLIAERKKAGKP